MKTVLTGGCFNKIHEGHVFLLKEAKNLGDRLVVILAHDNHNNKKAKAIPSELRKINLESLGIADVIDIGDSDNFYKVLLKYNPKVIVLGYDQKLPEDTIPYVEKMKIEVVKMKKLEI